jgi:hypothetical protein
MLVGIPKKQICSHLMIADHDGQKNRNGITNAVLFPQGVHWKKI